MRERNHRTCFSVTAFLCGLVMLLVSNGVAASLKVPAVAGALTVDAKLDEPLWHDARIFSLGAPGFGAAFPAGGEIRLAVCGTHLCLAARLPEAGRLVAMS